MELTPSYRLICSDDIHSQLQGNELAFTLFDFCINPSHEDKCKECILSSSLNAWPCWTLPCECSRGFSLMFSGLSPQPVKPTVNSKPIPFRQCFFINSFFRFYRDLQPCIRELSRRQRFFVNRSFGRLLPKQIKHRRRHAKPHES